MSDYVILDQTSQVNLTGGFNRTYGGTGSSSNPSLTYTNYLYQWYAYFNNDSSAPSSDDVPKIFANNPNLLSKYKQISITWYRTQYSRRAYNPQGIKCSFFNSSDTNIGTIFNSIVTESGTTSASGTTTIAIPSGATYIKFEVCANNDQSGSNTTCQVSNITLLQKKGAKIGSTDCEVYIGSTPIEDIYIGSTEIG